MRTARLALLGLTLVGSPVWAEADVDPIRACIEDNLPAAFVETIELRTTDRSGAERTLRMRLYGRRQGDRTWQSRASIESPAAYRHIGVLILRKLDRTDMFVFTPELDRVRRVNRRAAAGPALGSPITYEDLHHVQDFLEQAQYRVTGVESLLGRPAYRLEDDRRAQADAGGPYTRFVAWIDQATCVLMKGELYGRGSGPVKVLQVQPENVERRGGVWFPSRFTLSDVAQGVRTEVSIISFETSSSLPDSEFTETALLKGAR